MLFDNVFGIKLKGANFKAETELYLFKNNNDVLQRNCLLYGRNGTGKSTISRAFKYLSGENGEYIDEANLIDKDGNTIILDDITRKNIHVFNEDYIRANIDLPEDEDGLKTIVVLGEEVSVEKELKLAESELKRFSDIYDTKYAEYIKYDDEKNEESPVYYQNIMISKLKGDNSWARRDADISGKANNSRVANDKYKSFAIRTPKKDRNALIVDYSKKIDYLNAVRTGQKRIEPELKTEGYLSFDQEAIVSLLSKKIEKPVLTEREKKLLILQKQKGEKHIILMKEILHDESRCPYCLQDISVDYKEQLITSIENILNEEVEIHAANLRKMFINEINFSFPDTYNDIDRVLLDTANKKLAELNLEISTFNELIQHKINDPYTPINEPECLLRSKYQGWLNALKLIEDARCKYNSSIEDTTTLEKELHEINDDIAYYDIHDDYILLNRKISEKESKLLELNDAKMNRDITAENVKKLLDKKKSIAIACDKINDGLKYIFFSDDRLSIEPDGDKYILKSRGENVLPKKVSVGERNAIALCYFFSEIMKDKKQDDALKNQYMIVIDDPVSSFDMDNRIGILSYLKLQVNAFYKGNNKDYCLIMTHDLQTAYDLDNVLKGITNEKITWELDNNALLPNTISSRNEYSLLMRKIYSYANGKLEGETLYIGNIMRRVVEAYSTFLYKDKMINLPILAKDELGGYADRFENLMYRLVLNGESHTETRMSVMLNDDFFEYISYEEKQRTAKEILCMLYLINPKHILQHIKCKELDEKTIISTIESWLGDISYSTPDISPIIINRTISIEKSDSRKI